MNEELQVALARIIETTISAKDFVLEQAPDVIHQLLAWKLVESLFWFLFAFIILIPIKKLYKDASKSGWCFESVGAYGCKESIPTLRSVVFIVYTIASIIIFGVNISSLDWLQIWIAPKVYLLEYASSLVG